MTNTNQRTALVRCALLALLCGCSTAETDSAAVDIQPVVAAHTALVTARPFTETLTATGVVVPRAGAVAQLSAPTSARVARVFVHAGQHVTRGAPLVEFEQAPFLARAQAAEAALQSATAAAERARRLVTQGIVARREQEQADATLATTRADAELARRDAQLSRMDAPIAGVVTIMNAMLGASVDASQPLVEIVDSRMVDILLQVSANDAAQIRRGARVQLSSGQGADARALGASSVVDVGSVVDVDTRSVAVRISASGLNRPVRIGETILAAITIDEVQDALAVPTEALVPNGEGFSVFVVDTLRVVHERAVTIGGVHEDHTRILTGLAPGERVVTYGAFGMTDGAKVKADTNAGAKSP